MQEELRRQGETIDKVQQDMENIESQLKRADKQLRIFLRWVWCVVCMLWFVGAWMLFVLMHVSPTPPASRMASDKSVILFIFLIVVALSIGIAFFALKQTCPTSCRCNRCLTALLWVRTGGARWHAMHALTTHHHTHTHTHTHNRMHVPPTGSGEDPLVQGSCPCQPDRHVCLREGCV